MSSLPATDNSLSTLLNRPGIQQFIKFCIVGFSSTLIDFGVLLVLLGPLHFSELIHNPELAPTLAVTLSFLLAVTNGFYWNNRWTFSHVSRENAHRRFLMFLATNLVGLVLNVAIVNLVAGLVPAAVSGFLAAHFHLPHPPVMIGKVFATGIVLIWNFTASRLWTFKS